ncbi:LysR family transcriptional regulator [Bacillus gobiensis]|uniref:LysR family transcriptional regulator n=1 Tax=Bacillus gobiensis TaxID=1441095 RepID=UPI003D21B3F6
MNLHALKLFYIVTEMGSITKAAKELRISQPAVSSQLKKFEKELGFSLFKQDGRGISLTEFGIELAEKAQNLFALEKQIELFIEDYRLARRGKLRIAATYLPANFLIPHWAASFKKENEDVELLITTTNSKGAFDRLQQYKADIAVFGGDMSGSHPTTIDAEELYEDELWFVVSPEHKYANQIVSLHQIIQEPFIMREKGSSTRERLFSLCQTYNVQPPMISLQFNGLHEAIRSVMAGYGANFVSSIVVREYVERGLLARVFVNDIHLTNNIAICVRKTERQSELVKKFIDICKRETLSN